MSRTNSEEQLNFLLKCVKHSNNGKVDFVAVAAECGIVSKGAAAKRYERMMKANGINPNGGSPSGQSPPASPSPNKASTPSKGAKGSPPKRRKAAKNSETPSKKSKLKAETEFDEESQSPLVKDEDAKENGHIFGGGMYKSATNPDPMLSETATGAADLDAAALFSEFCHPVDSDAETIVENGSDGALNSENGGKAKYGSKGGSGSVDSVIVKEEQDVPGNWVESV